MGGYLYSMYISYSYIKNINNEVYYKFMFMNKKIEILSLKSLIILSNYIYNLCHQVKKKLLKIKIKKL